MLTWERHWTKATDASWLWHVGASEPTIWFVSISPETAREWTTTILSIYIATFTYSPHDWAIVIATVVVVVVVVNVIVNCRVVVVEAAVNFSVGDDVVSVVIMVSIELDWEINDFQPGKSPKRNQTKLSRN